MITGINAQTGTTPAPSNSKPIYGCGDTFTGTATPAPGTHKIEFNQSWNVTFECTADYNNIEVSLWQFDNRFATNGNNTCSLPPRELPGNVEYTMRIWDHTVPDYTNGANYSININCQPLKTIVIDIDTEDPGIATKTAESSDFVDSILFDLILFIAGYAIIMIGFVFGLSCCNNKYKINDSSLKVKLFVLVITLILEAMDVITDSAQVMSMKRGAECGVTSCFRKGEDYAMVMIPFICIGAAITFFGNVIFFYLWFKNMNKDKNDETDKKEERIWKIEMILEIAKFWLEDIPILCILIAYQSDDYLDPNNQNAFVPYTATQVLYVSLIFTGIDFFYAMMVFCCSLHFGQHFKNKNSQKWSFCGCITFTFIVLIIIYLSTWGIALNRSQESAFKTSDVDGYCIGSSRNGDALTYSIPGSNGYEIRFWQGEPTKKIAFAFISTPSEKIRYEAKDCTYSANAFPETGQCTVWSISCTKVCGDNSNVGCNYLQSYSYSITNLTICADVCIE